MIGITFGLIVVTTFWAIGEPHYAWAYIGLWILFAGIGIYKIRRLPRVKNESTPQDSQR